MKVLLIVLLLSFPVFSQTPAIDPKALPPTKPPVIAMPSEMIGVLKSVNDKVRIAQLEKVNLILQARLLLNVPNDYLWDDQQETFVAPPPKAVEPAKAEPKKDEKKP